MNILIRCDSSYQIGSGHVFRCLSLAQLLREKGHHIAFISRHLDKNVIHLIEEKQFKVYRLPAPTSIDAQREKGDLYASWLEVSESQDIAESKNVITDFKAQAMIVDHYGLTVNWEKNIKSAGLNVFVIDDLFRAHFCDGLLDQNYHLTGKELYAEAAPGAKLFLGPEFALLAEPILKLKINAWAFFQVVDEILVFFGGADPAQESVRFLRLLPLTQIQNRKVHLVIGSQNPMKDEILKAAQKFSSVQVHVQTKAMDQLLSRVQLFIGSGGTTTWERARLGIPALCVAVAENQVSIASRLDKIKAHQYLGASQELSDEKFIDAINQVLSDAKKRELYYQNSLQLKVSTRLNEVVSFFI